MLESIILGIIQGITEFLPISSTAHLILFPWFFDWNGDVDTLTFDMALHAGTLAALFACFWRDWRDLVRIRQKLLMFIIIGTIPAGAAGFYLNDIVAGTLRSPLLISVMLISIGLVMLVAEKMYKYKSMDEIQLPDAVMIGIAQTLALIPGVSRSGITIAAGLFRGFEREAAAHFSFLLSTPLIAAAVVLHGVALTKNPEPYNMELFVAGFIASAVTGYIALKFLLNFLKKYPLNIFVYYRFALAAVIIALIWLKG